MPERSKPQVMRQPVGPGQRNQTLGSWTKR
jgi:hypothetical protein